MEIGMVGLGRMGANLVRRLVRGGHRCAVYDVDPSAVTGLGDDPEIGGGVIATGGLGELAAALSGRRAVWIMVPAAAVDSTIEELAPHLGAGDIVIDGGNSNHRDDIARAERLAGLGIAYVDVGTSGGVFGLERGYCLMIGGEREPVAHLDPIFATIAPGSDAAARSHGRDGEVTTAEHGYLHCGPAGAGHFVKMVHNGIEYGLMAAYAEGLAVLRSADMGGREHAVDAETAPLRDADAYRYELDVAEIAEVWRRGSVVSSWLLDLAAAALHEDPGLDAFSGHVADSGEGRWTVQAAIDIGVPTPVLAAALFERFSSRGHADDANRLLSAMRHQFGGHAELVPDDVDGDDPGPPERVAASG